MLSLTLKLQRPLLIQPLLVEIGTALQEILGLTFIPVIVAEEYLNWTRIPLQSDELRLDSNMIFFEISNESEIVSVNTYAIKEPLLSDEEQGIFVSIAAEIRRTPLEVALAASVAVTFGRELGNPIQDLATFYTPVLSQSGESFINAIKVREPFDDYHLAAKTFYDALLRA